MKNELVLRMLEYFTGNIWFGNSLTIRKVGDRVGEGSEYRNGLWRVTIHIEVTGRFVMEKEARQTLVS